MILSAHQPAYLPWLGYFDKIARSDIFIYLDTVQFEKNSFINRNKIKTPQGAQWLTIPVRTKDHLNSTICELKFDYTKAWRENHLKSIYANYKKAPRFDMCYPKIEAIYMVECDNFADLCYSFLLFWLNELRINTTIVRSKDLDIKSKKSELILDICKHFKADHYISGPLGKAYLNEQSFEDITITLEYQDYKHPKYSQLWGEFLPYMSILDFWMNTDAINLF